MVQMRATGERGRQEITPYWGTQIMTLIMTIRMIPVIFNDMSSGSSGPLAVQPQGSCHMAHLTSRVAALTLIALACQGAAHAADAVLNIYSARHYQTDEALYKDFTK